MKNENVFIWLTLGFVIVVFANNYLNFIPREVTNWIAYGLTILLLVYLLIRKSQLEKELQKKN